MIVCHAEVNAQAPAGHAQPSAAHAAVIPSHVPSGCAWLAGSPRKAYPSVVTPTEEIQPAVTPKLPIGRPSGFSLELADRVCRGICAGQSIRTVCKADDMPDIATVFRWMRQYPDFCEQYTRATLERTELHAEDMIDIADDSSADYAERLENGKASVLADHDHINRARLRVDTRKWIASKLLPKKYGDQPAVQVDLNLGLVAVPEAPQLPAGRVIDVLSAEPKSE